MKHFYIVLLLLFSSYSYSQNPCPGVDPINYGGQLYHTVQIGSQCWLKENLNIGTMVPGVQNQANNGIIEKYCYNDDTANCTIYGGLYMWDEAMQYSTTEGGQGICPSGWHIPYSTEFTILTTSVGGNGNALKEFGQGSGGGAGTNTSGFSALLAGERFGDVSYNGFDGLGIYTNFWSSTENSHNNTEAMIIGLINDNNEVNGPVNDDKEWWGFSVRCIKDNVGSLLLQSPNGGEQWEIGSIHDITWVENNVTNVKIEYTTNNGNNWIKIIESTPASIGRYSWQVFNTPSSNCKIRISDLYNVNTVSVSNNIFSILFGSSHYCPGLPTVDYGGQTYNTVKIGSQCWLKENLNIGKMVPAVKGQQNNDSIEKFCYNDDSVNCTIYGGLYQWREAVGYTLKTNPRGICPVGWHIPSHANFDTLIAVVNSDGNALKEVGQGGGTNYSGFSALLAGYNSEPSFRALGIETDFWSSNFYYSNCCLDETGLFADYLGLFDDASFNNDDLASIYKYSRLNKDASILIEFRYAFYGRSIRCVKDNDGLWLQSPYGVEGWQVGSQHNISWGFSNVKDIKIEYTTDSGSNWVTIVESTPASAGNYTWTVPNTPSSNCLVKISDTKYSSSSDNIFTIYKGSEQTTIEHGGQIYNTVVIGKQRWFKENLNIGTMIPSSICPTTNGIIEKYCYNDDTANCTIYGGFYLGSEFSEPGFCPTGWHIGGLPPKSEVIFDGNALKSVGQGLGFGAGTNTSGFSALLGGSYILLGLSSTNTSGFSTLIDGSYSRYPGYFEGLGSYAAIGSGIPDRLHYYDGEIESFNGPLMFGSTRCVADNLDAPLPVELTSFTSIVTNNIVKLNWNTTTEINSSSFEVEKKTSNSNTWQKIASVHASGNSNSPKHYSYTDKNVNTGKYNYRLKMVDNDGVFKYSSVVDAEIAAPLKFELANAYPNPWNPTTTIHYEVPTNILVTIKVFDAIGREVAILVNEVKSAGRYEIILNSNGLSSGVYFYQMRAGNFIETKKINLIK